jgi:hypothetical protein
MVWFASGIVLKMRFGKVVFVESSQGGWRQWCGVLVVLLKVKVTRGVKPFPPMGSNLQPLTSESLVVQSEW